MITSTPDQWSKAARLVRCTGFGATGAEVDAAVAVGADRYLAGVLAADPTADAGALATPPPEFAPLPRAGNDADAAAKKTRNAQIRQQLQQLAGWWLRRMAAAQVPFGEKLTFCWHNHFATSATKVHSAQLMLGQNQKLRSLGRGDFRPLALAMLSDAALLDWLDGQKNTAGAPNENLAREFLELFSLGRQGGYTEQDVREGARALTGRRIGPDGSTAIRPKLHDDDSKTFLGVTGNLDEIGFCDAILARPAAATQLATRMYGQFVSDDPPSPAAIQAAVRGYGTGRSISGMLSVLLGSAEFTAAAGSKIVGPVEWLLGAVRALAIPIPDQAAAMKMLAILRGLGQIPFYPPSVAGWPSGSAWLSTGAADLRMASAAALVKRADLDSMRSGAPAGRVETARHLLGVPAWGPRTAAVLRDSVSNPEQLMTIALNSPEYLTH